jgi:hypothetical protein
MGFGIAMARLKRALVPMLMQKGGQPPFCPMLDGGRAGPAPVLCVAKSRSLNANVGFDRNCFQFIVG